jgi:integrase
MASAKMRYVTQHRRAGRVYWYWQRKGFPLKRLSDDLEERFIEQLRLNAVADDKGAAEPAPPREDTVAAVVTAYEASDSWRDLAPGTKRVYGHPLQLILGIYGNSPIAELDRAEIIDFLERIPGRSPRKQAACVLSNLFAVAQYRGLVVHNPARALRLKSNPRRDTLWTDSDCAAFLAECDRPHVATYFLLCRYTAQRPGDVAAMTWRQFDGETIEVRQEKTGKLVAIPPHATLRAHLEGISRDSIQICGGHNTDHFRRHVRQIRKRAGLGDLQARDLRRSAMVAMAEAGAEIQDIAAVSGHTIERSKNILETYIVRTRAMAARAVNLWEESK